MLSLSAFALLTTTVVSAGYCQDALRVRLAGASLTWQQLGSMISSIPVTLA